MRPLIERFVLKLALLVLGMLLVGKLVDVGIGLLGQVLTPIGKSWVGGPLFLASTVLFIVGLGVRDIRALTRNGVRGGREQAAQVRQSRQAVRRPAQDVPVMAERVIPVDRDPVLDDGED